MSKMFIDEVHAQNVLQRMWEQTERNELCDVSLIAGDIEKMQISAHRSVLCASSEFFETMFKPPFNESTAKEVKLPNVDGETLKALVKFCYSGRLEINEDNAEKLLITADSLLLEPVFNACGKYLAEQLHPSNCLGIAQLAQLAERHHCKLLSEKAKDFCLKQFVELYKSDEFLNLSVEQLTQLLSSDDLRDPTEEHVFKSLILWLEHNRSEREKHKDEMLKLVRLPFLKPQFLSAHVQQVCTSSVSLQLYKETTDWHLLPKRRTVIASEFTEPRRRGERLMAIRRGKKNKMDILYHCPQKFKWMKWLENLRYRPNFGVAIMGDDLFILGGYARDVVVNTVICLNLKTMNLKNVNPMNECRGGLGAAVINGFLYAVGGWNGHDLSSVEKWDSKSNTWTMVASMSVSRYFFGITVFNGKMYVVGGHDNDTVVNSAECYNPQENVWTSIASMCVARKFVKLAVANGILYAVGGNGIKTMERYNHESNTWTMMCSFSEKIIYGSIICTTFNDKLIAVYMDRVEEYNSVTNMCKLNTSIKGLEDVMHTFTFSGLLDSKFIED